MKNKYSKFPEKFLKEKIDELKIQLIQASKKFSGQKIPKAMSSNIIKEITPLRIKLKLRIKNVRNF